MEHGLPHYASTAGMCGFCGADYGQNPFTDHRPGASWRRTTYSHEQLKGQSWAQRPLLQVRGVVPETVQFDSMHVIECSGTANHAVANFFFEHIFERGGKIRGTMSLWEDIQEAYRVLGITADHRVGHFTFSKVGNDGAPHTHYPVLTGIKARQCRYLVAVANFLGEKEKGKSEHNMHVSLCLRALSTCCDVIDRNQWFLGDGEHQVFSNSVQHFLVHYQWLSKEAARQEKCLWSMTPKFHYMHHLVAQSRFLSPKASRLYGSEDMVGKICKLGASCLASTPSHKMPNAVIAKYRFAMHMLLEFDE